MKTTHSLSWNETSFLAKVLLFLKANGEEGKKIWSSDPVLQANGYCALSSTYYSIAGSAYAQLKLGRGEIAFLFFPIRFAIWCVTWLPLAMWCYWRMLPLSNSCVKLVGYDGMTAEQCDVRQSILRRRGKYDEAKRCISTALNKGPEKAHTRGLLRVGLAEILRLNDDWVGTEREAHSAVREAERAEKEEPQQAARIYRQCAVVFSSIERHAMCKSLYEKAATCAEASGALDQLLKL